MDGLYQEVINSDLRVYGGNTLKLHEERQAEAETWHGQQFSLNITLPALSCIILKPMSVVEESVGDDNV